MHSKRGCWMMASAVALISAGATEVIAQTPLFARLQPGNIIEVFDPQHAAWRSVYHSTGWSVSDLTVSPGNDRLAFLAWTEGVVGEHDYATLPHSELTVIDTAGRVTFAGLRDVQRYTWCGRACLAYIKGQYEESHDGFRPQAVGAADLVTGVDTPLPSPPFPIALAWADFDKAIYLKNRPREGEPVVYRLDLSTRLLQSTTLRDIRFSPSGRYYLHKPDLADSLLVYETRSNMPVDVSRFRREASLLEWGSPNEDLVLAVRRTRPRTDHGAPPVVKRRKPGEPVPEATYLLYDVESGRTRRTAKGLIGQWVGSDHRHLVQHGGDYQVLD